MLHYHGTPITPAAELLRLAGRSFCVSYADRRQVEMVHQIGSSVMLDNGAFSLWRRGRATNWPGFYRWVDPWLDWPTTWAVIPDVIDGGSEANDALIAQWPHGERGAPVWHLDEPIERLLALADRWPRICFGSAGAYARVGTPAWHDRMASAFDALAPRHRRLPWIHMLRGLSQAGGPYPLASADSSTVARNYAGNVSHPAKDPALMAARFDRLQCPGRWAGSPARGEQLQLELEVEEVA